MDSDHGYILSYQGVHGNRHESPCFIALLEDIPLELRDICGDKGFDSEKNQRYITKHSKGCSYLDVGGKPKRGKCRKRVYRQKHEHQWKNRYKQMRNAIESKNYSFKHRFSDFTPGMDIHARRRYLAIRVFTLNLITLQKSENTFFLCFVIIKVFYDPLILSK